MWLYYCTIKKKKKKKVKINVCFLNLTLLCLTKKKKNLLFFKSFEVERGFLYTEWGDKYSLPRC